MEILDQSFVCPPRSAPESEILAFLKRITSEGETFLSTQSAFPDLARAKESIAGTGATQISNQLSKVNVNLVKRIIRDIVATMSNLRPLWGYSSDNPDLDTNSVILNKLLLNWYQTTFADRKIKEWCQYASIGAGYIGPTWESEFWSRGRGDISLKVYGPQDVLVYQLPTDHNIQRAYITTLREETPINLGRALFPTMAGKIVPDREAPAGMRKADGRVMSYLSPVLSRFGMGGKNKQVLNSVFPVVDIYQSYVLDLSINEGQEPVVMGEPGTYWSYTVPPLNSRIPDGKDKNGNQVYRLATATDASLYPFRRLITWTNTGILRDDTSPWWHGKVPAVKLSFDNWAWEFLGFSMTRDLDSINDSSNTKRRAMDDMANAKLRPALMYDDRTMAQQLMQTFDLRIPGNTIPVDFTATENPIRPILGPEYYNVPNFIPDMIAKEEEMMKYISGVNDFSSIAKARQLPSSDTVEKIMEMAGPLVTDISRDMEAALGELGEMVKGMFFEFYTAPRRLQVLGKDGLSIQDTQTDGTPAMFYPGELVPTHLPNEDWNGPSAYSYLQRAKMYMNSFFFKITPNSLHNITQMTRKLLYVQLQKAGFPIDPWTMAEVMDVPNFGHPPEGAKTVMERWTAFERMKGELSAFIQAKSQEILQAEQLQFLVKQAALQGGNPSALQPPAPTEDTPPQGGLPNGNSLPQPSPSPALGVNGPGRPAEFNGNPTIQQKDGGTRSTITSS